MKLNLCLYKNYRINSLRIILLLHNIVSKILGVHIGLTLVINKLYEIHFNGNVGIQCLYKPDICNEELNQT